MVIRIQNIDDDFFLNLITKLLASGNLNNIYQFLILNTLLAKSIYQYFILIITLYTVAPKENAESANKLLSTNYHNHIVMKCLLIVSVIPNMKNQFQQLYLTAL